MPTTQVFRATIRQGHEQSVRGWVSALGGRAETGAALEAEGIASETVFLEERDGRLFLWVHQHVDDPARANAVFMASTNPVDVELRAQMAAAWERVDFFSPQLAYVR